MFGWGKKSKTTEAPAEGEARAARKAKAEPPEKPAKAAAVDVEEAHDHEHEHLDLKVKVTSREGCVRTLSVQVPAQEVEEETENSFRRVQAQARIPGFRQGKAPMEMVRKNYEGAAREDALDRLLKSAVHEALHQEKIDPVAVPTVTNIKYDLKKPLQFEVKVECAPDVKLKDYRGLTLTKKVKKITDAEIDKKVEEFRENNAKLVESTDTVVGEKHFVVADYSGAVDGKPLEGGEAKGQLIDMSAPQSLAGFTQGLVGAKVGETKEVPVNFPADHFNKDLAGKSAIFNVTVTALKEKKLPDIDDEFAKDLGCESLADLRDRLRKNMETEFARGARRDIEKQASDKLLENNVFEVPPSIVEERAKDLSKHLKEYLMRQGASEDDWKANESKMADKNKAEAERQVRLSYLLTWIRDAEKIEASDAEVEDVLQKSVEATEAAKREQMKKWMESRRDSLRAQLVEEKIYSFLIDNAKVTEVPADR